MHYIDFHADTLTEIKTGSLQKNNNDIDLNRVSEFADKYVQIFAIWKDMSPVNIDCNNIQAVDKQFKTAYDKAISLLHDSIDRVSLCSTYEEIEEAVNSGKSAALLSIEDLSVMGSYVEECRDFGFSIAMPVWNYENRYGYGAAYDQDGGLKSEGKEILRTLQNKGIIVDVSHLSDAGIKDVFNLNDGPVIASHSNARAVCDMARNLPDDYIKEIIGSKGVIGINLYRPFVTPFDRDGSDKDFEMIVRHIDHIIEIGGENNVVMGNDFDGCEGNLPCGICGVQSVPNLYSYLGKHGFDNPLLDKLFWTNGMNFLKVCL